MKKIIFYLTLGLLLIVTASCQNAEKEKVLNKNLTSFTFKTDEGKILTGIKNTLTNRNVIEPIETKSVEADAYVITITDLSNHKQAYTSGGIKLGIFDSFTHWQTSTQNYYHGVAYNKNCYYFPEKRLVCRGAACYQGGNVLFLEKKEAWNVMDYQGNKLFEIKAPFYILKSIKDKDREKLYVAMPKGRFSYILCSSDGSNKKKLSKKNWQKIERSFIHSKQLSSTVLYAETDKI